MKLKIKIKKKERKKSLLKEKRSHEMSGKKHID